MEDIFILNCLMTLIVYIQFFGSVFIHLYDHICILSLVYTCTINRFGQTTRGLQKAVPKRHKAALKTAFETVY